MQMLHGDFERKEKLLAKMTVNMYNSYIIDIEVHI